MHQHQHWEDYFNEFTKICKNSSQWRDPAIHACSRSYSVLFLRAEIVRRLMRLLYNFSISLVIYMRTTVKLSSRTWRIPCRFLLLRTTSCTHPRDLAPTEHDNEDMPPTISIKYPGRQRIFRNSLELLYPSFSSSPRLSSPFFVSPATTNKGRASTSFSFSSSSTFPVKMMRTLEPPLYHPFSISHPSTPPLFPFLSRATLPSHSYSPRTSSFAFPLLSTRHFSVALSPSSVFCAPYTSTIHVAILANFVRSLPVAKSFFAGRQRTLLEGALSIRR